MPPTANGAITLNTANSGKTAFLNEGFSVTLNSDAAITGAYLRFKEKEGEAAGSYYDINLSDNNSSGKSTGKENQRGITLRTAKNQGLELDVDFTSNIEPGTFCYELCVYDADGNISVPQEICVVVESWGGKADLVGSWDMTKIEEIISEDTDLETIIVGIEDCENKNFVCVETGVSMPYQDCYTLQFGLITFKADGTFTTSFKDKEKDLNYDATAAQCAIVYDVEREDEDNYKGYWAYNATNSNITLVAYENTSVRQGVSKTERFVNGDGELIFDGPLVVGASTMTISDEDYNLDGSINNKDMFYFDKK